MKYNLIHTDKRSHTNLIMRYYKIDTPIKYYSSSSYPAKLEFFTNYTDLICCNNKLDGDSISACVGVYPNYYNDNYAFLAGRQLASSYVSIMDQEYILQTDQRLITQILQNNI
jgi:hypothetical protein